VRSTCSLFSSMRYETSHSLGKTELCEPMGKIGDTLRVMASIVVLRLGGRKGTVCREFFALVLPNSAGYRREPAGVCFDSARPAIRSSFDSCRPVRWVIGFFSLALLVCFVWALSALLSP